MEIPLNNVKDGVMKLIKSLVTIAACTGIAMAAFANPAQPAAQNNICQTNLQACQQKNPQQAARCEKTAEHCNAKLAKQENRVQAQQPQQQPQQQNQ